MTEPTIITRTQREILDRIEELAPDDFFGFGRGVLIDSLEFEQARPFLKDGVTAEEWQAKHVPAVREAVLAQMADYFPFAWGKMEDERGISANRSVVKFEAWLWLLGESERGVLERFVAAPYEMYGRPKLELLAEVFGWPRTSEGAA